MRCFCQLAFCFVCTFVRGVIFATGQHYMYPGGLGQQIGGKRLAATLGRCGSARPSIGSAVLGTGAEAPGSLSQILCVGSGDCLCPERALVRKHALFLVIVDKNQWPIEEDDLCSAVLFGRRRRTCTWCAIGFANGSQV